MENLVGIVHELGENRSVQHRISNVGEAGTAFEVTDIPHGPGRQIIKDGDFVFSIQQSFGKMGADKPRPTRDQIVHSTPNRVSGYPERENRMTSYTSILRKD
jgi:hypothetical protein